MSDVPVSTSLLKFHRLLEVLRKREAKAGIESGPRDLASLFGEEGLDRQVLANVVFRMVRTGLRPDLRSDACDPSWDIPLLHLALRRALLTDPLLEQVLTAARRRYLDSLVQGKDLDQHDRRMIVSLAAQSFNNEYVWFVDDEEQGRLDALLARARLNAAPTVELIAACAMYMPLKDVVQSVEPLASPGLWAADELAALNPQIAEWAAEQKIKPEIPSLRMNVDETTASVRQQYEAFPYPRWFGVTVAEPSSLKRMLATDFGFAADDRVSRPLDVLVAGCGTGKHPIRVASDYHDVRVLGVDISRASLAHASSRARALGLKNLEFLQADLLDLGELNRRFDVIECVGVLHHLADPSAGLQALVAVLRQGGMMKIGVYSRRARRGLARIQELAAMAEQADGKAGLRRVRHQLLGSHEVGRVRLLSSRDFYYLSGCRDLLCHAHEVTFTPAGVKDWLESCDLEFLGYAGLSDNTMADFRRRYPGDSSIRDLATWDRFEEEFPDTFFSVQKFWARRRVASEAS